MYTSPTFLPPTTPWPLLFFLFFSFFCDLPSAIFIALMLVGPESQLARGYLQAWSRICGAFYSTENFRIFWLVCNQMERTISVWSDQNLQDQLWWWSSLTDLAISVGWIKMYLLIWENRCPQYHSFVSCLQEQVYQTCSGSVGSTLCNRNVLLHWAREISNRNFCWMESALEHGTSENN